MSAGRQKLLVVAGPTASGKTALAVELALRLSGEIVSMDSMQIYARMTIGTASPTEEEKRGVPHHLLNFVPPEAPFSCVDWASLAREKIAEIASRGRLPILCGGTGLYLDTLLRASDLAETEGSPAIRAELTDFARAHGAEALYERLATVDPVSAAAIHPNNVRRMIRALEIYHTTGKTKSEWDRLSREAESPYEATVIIPEFRERQRLYDRIDRRVTVMLEAGLEAEVRALYDDGLLSGSGIAAQAIGYKEFLPYFRGERTIEEVADDIRMASRRYAKRQLTWFRRYTDAIRVYPDADGAEAPLRTAAELADEVIGLIPDT